jgi:hypothetical protein
MVLRKKANIFLLHYFIGHIHLIMFILGTLNAFTYLVQIVRQVLITFHLALHIEWDGPHTPCSHAMKLKDGTKG